MAKSYSMITTKPQPKPQMVKDRPDQVKNSAGGFVYSLDKWSVLDRFLILGSESPTYYASAKTLTIQNAKNVIKLIEENGVKVVNRIVEISSAGRAPKNSPALFALALAISVGDDATRKAAADALPQVARTGTHLFEFLNYTTTNRGWGRGLKRAVSQWYLGKTPDQAAYQVVKYRNREGWSHRDVLRLSKPSTKDELMNGVFAYATGKPFDAVPAVITGFQAAQTANSKELLKLIPEYNLTWEMLPDAALKDVKVWEAMVASKSLPLTAALRNLGRMSALNVSDQTVQLLVDMITNEDALRKARVHPLAVLVALNTYRQGRGVRGSLTWTVNTKIVDALDKAFYLSFGSVEATGKRVLLALDVSGSMSGGEIAGMTGVTPRIGSVAMAMVTAATEKNYEIVGFTSGSSRTQWGANYGAAITALDVSPRRRLDDNIKTVSSLPFGGTDCALPMIWAKENSKKFDAFVIYTDNETWAGNVKPDQALRDYRKSSGISDSKLIVVGMTATGFTIADPKDSNMLDVVGFDTSAPQIMSEFIRG